MALKSATTTLATIQMRHGAEENFDSDQMTAGEWAVSEDKKYVRMCFMPGLCLRMATYEAFEKDMEEIRTILVEAQDIQLAIQTWYKLAESYAHGGTGAREGEETDNAKYYAEQAKISADNAAAVADIGIMTTEKVGIGKPDGTTITVDEDGTMHSVGGGSEKGSVTGVKGSTESAYRHGDVNISPENLGITVVNNTADANKNVNSAKKDGNGNTIDSTYAKKSIYGDTFVSLGRTDGTTVGENSFAYGDNVTASGKSSHAGGTSSTASGEDSFAHGKNCYAKGKYSISLGYNSESDGIASFSNGRDLVSVGSYSHSEGYGTTASYILGHAEGYKTEALGQQNVIGRYNDKSVAKGNMGNVPTSGTSTNTAFCIGNGASESALSNAARIDYNGKLWCKQAYSSTGADYAELFEWADGNPDNEDRRGYFVTVEGKKIKKAQAGDYILGIISGNPSVIGNTDMEWYGQFMRDEFGTFIKENYKETITEPVIGEEGNVTEEEREVDVEFYKVNPDYDPDAPYTFRLDRPEWDAVGMVGVLPVRDDGTCDVGKFCKCTDGGIATLSAERGFDTYMVIERVSENIVSVILK